MKYSTLLVAVLLTFKSLAQNNCDYKINVDTDEELFKLTQESLIDYAIGDKKTVFVYFSLMKQEDIKSVVLHISLNSEEIPPLICFNDKSRIAFKLSNGEFVSAPYLGEETCGRQTMSEEAMNNSTSEASFYLAPQTIESLLNAGIVSMRIFTVKNNFDLVLQDVISNPNLKKSIYPKEFFMNSLKCID